MNNALNGVAMNLEVARLRAVPGADAGRVAPFAAAAAEAHEEVVAMVRALMALARGPLDAPGDVREAAVQLVALLAPTVRARGGALVLDGAGAPACTTATTAAVRLAAAELLTAAADDPAREWRCTVTSGPTPSLALAAAGGPVARAVAFPSS